MSKVVQIESGLEKPSQGELREVHDRLPLIEDDMEFTTESESAIEKSEREMTRGLRPRTRQP